MNGRLDLAQVEGLGDLLAAETAAQQRQALRSMDGALSRLAASWRGDLVEALALIEASIDFADEDLPEALAHGVDGRSARVAARAWTRELRRQPRRPSGCATGSRSPWSGRPTSASRRC